MKYNGACCEEIDRVKMKAEGKSNKMEKKEMRLHGQLMHLLYTRKYG